MDDLLNMPALKNIYQCIFGCTGSLDIATLFWKSGVGAYREKRAVYVCSIALTSPRGYHLPNNIKHCIPSNHVVIHTLFKLTTYELRLMVGEKSNLITI